MPKFDPEWFDIISIFSREGKPGYLSIHAFKQPYICQQFFIPAAMVESPTFWEDVHKLAVELWEANKRSEDDISTCPRCGTSRKNWKRWYEGRAFCGFCGLDTDGPDPLSRVIRISKGNYS